MRFFSGKLAGFAARKGDTMQVIVQSKTVEVTEALRGFIHKQLSRLLKNSERITTTTVFLETVKRKKNDTTAMRVKICIDLPSAPFCVEREGTDLYQVVVDAAHRAQRYVRKKKEKRLHALRDVPSMSEVVSQATPSLLT